MRVFRQDVDVVEEVFAHKGVITVLVLDGQVAVFVQIVGADGAEADIPVAVLGDQILVQGHGGGAGGKAQRGVRLASDQRNEDLARRDGDLRSVVKDPDIH